MFSLGWTTWGAPVVCTNTKANPAVVSFSTVNFPNGQPAFLATTGTLPSPFVAGTIYYLVNAGMNTHGLAATPGGTAISTNGSSQTGTQICNIIGNACVYLGNLTTILQDAGTAASYPGSLSMTVSYPQATFSAFNAALIGDSEVGAYELGNKITFNQAGYITSIMFEKYSGESITTRGLNIWTTGGVNLKNYTTTGEPTGTTQWITYTLATPYAVTAGESLVISAGYATAFLNLGPPFLYPAGQSPYLQAIAGFNTTSVGSFPSNTGGTYPVDVGFQPSSYAAPTIHYFVLKGSDGNSRIVVWNEEVYNSGVSDNIEFTFGSSYATINIYDPVQGTSAISTLTNQSSVSLTLSDSQINVIELISVVLVVGQFAFNSATQSGLIPVMFGM
jgi:hypothetical protein